ncbi:MAG: protease modulator HflC [Pirellulaceae bacterium]
MHLAMFSSEQDPTHPGSRIGLGRAVLVLLLLALLAGIGTRTLFFVDETEYVYVTQFGQPLRLHTEAGLGIKWPYQSLRRFDRRLQIFGPPPREILTEDKENLEFEWFVCWRIPGASFFDQAGANHEPSSAAAREQIEIHVERFMQSVGSIDAAERRLEERIQAAIAAVIGRTRLSQLVSLDPSELALDEISDRVTQSIRRIAAEQFGIEVVDVRLKRFGYPDAVKPAVYAEIRSERERVAVQYRAEGASEKAKIESQADLQRDQLLAQARREATIIRGEGEAKAIEIFNAAHRKDPQFYEFLKTLETYRNILDDQTTIVLSGDNPLLKLLTEGVPDLERESEAATTNGSSTHP